MKVTVAQHDDLKDVLEMLTEYQESLESEMPIDEAKNEQYLEQILADHEVGTIFIGRTASGRQPVGFAIVCRRPSTLTAEWVPYMTDLYIRPAYRLKGFARQMFEHVVRWAKTKKYSRLDWLVVNLYVRAQYMFDAYNPTISGWVGYMLDLRKE